MNYENINEIFAILEQMANQIGTAMNITVPIFKDESGNYFIYIIFVQDTKEVENLISESQYQFFEKIKMIVDNPILLGIVSEEELNYILFAFNRKYGVMIRNDENLDVVKTINFYSHHALPVSISIHFNKNIIAYELLEQHFIGTKHNFFKYHNSSRDSKLIYNYKQSYSKYFDILDSCMLTENEGSIQVAYNTEIQKEGDPQNGHQKSKHIVFMPPKQ